VKTSPPSLSEISTIVRLRAQVEGLKLGSGVVEQLASIGENASLRYVLQLLSPSSILASLQGRTSIEKEDVSEVEELFLDARKSGGILGGLQGGASGGAGGLEGLAAAAAAGSS
jgi:RuvB-like protein 1